MTKRTLLMRRHILVSTSAVLDGRTLLTRNTQYLAEGEETDPGRGIDRILVRMVARLRNLVGNAPHCNRAVDNQRDDRDQDSKGNVVKDHRLCLPGQWCPAFRL